ncbi:hypothetical protein ODJ79_19985 [Actinoplanes sp. KI2]|uniref:hypothetical protein n=1 Tax=Actinoplanes sp. KI2 TaxID=2983315 RepID=UPI0021D58615|nr:hypothetical protein [Actinoplanes sp. KI2]MCU7726011.1 hypothetical protein [Actinoplanes sp. KI2]
MMDKHRERKVTWLVIGVFFLGLMIVSVAVFHTDKKNQAAVDKATQLSTELAQAGLPVPDAQQIYNVLGDDGGPVCAAPANALAKSILYGQLTNGAAGPGMRPVIADNKATQGVLLIVKVYCPDEAEHFQDVVNDLKYADVAS